MNKIVTATTTNHANHMLALNNKVNHKKTTKIQNQYKLELQKKNAGAPDFNLS